MSRGFWGVALAATCFFSPLAMAAEQDVDDTGKVEAIQNRLYRMGQEIEVSIGFLPADAFYKGIAPEGSYTLHFSDLIAWEIVRFGYSLNFDTNLKTQLQNLGAQPTAFPETQLFVTSSIIWSPMYFKATFFNSSVSHGEFYGLLGGGTFRQVTGQTGTFVPSVDIGVGGRMFLSQVVSLRLEVRENLLIQSNSQTSVIDINLGLSFNIGASD
jgi:outer membrane beta-barrel protein